MVFDRNLRFTIDLNDFPEFSRVRLWTPGICENRGMIRARSDPEWYPKRGVFEPCPYFQLPKSKTHGQATYAQVHFPASVLDKLIASRDPSLRSDFSSATNDRGARGEFVQVPLFWGHHAAILSRSSVSCPRNPVTAARALPNNISPPEPTVRGPELRGARLRLFPFTGGAVHHGVSKSSAQSWVFGSSTHGSTAPGVRDPESSRWRCGSFRREFRIESLLG